MPARQATDAAQIEPANTADADAPTPAPATPETSEPAPAPDAAPSETDAAPATPEAIDLAAGFAPEPVDVIPMRHPDGGACDAFPLDDAGNSLVPFNAIETMQAHGFVTAEPQG